MSDPALGLLMLGLIVVVIIMGFPTAFTLMGLGMFYASVVFAPLGWVRGTIWILVIAYVMAAIPLGLGAVQPAIVQISNDLDRAARLCDPCDVASIAAAIKEVVTNATLREELRGRARTYAAPYTWKRTAEQMLDVYRSLA